MHAQRSLGFSACRLGPLEGLTHTYSGPHQLHATTPRSSVAMVGTASGRGLGGSAAEFVLPPPPTPSPPFSFLLCLRRADAPRAAGEVGLSREARPPG